MTGTFTLPATPVYDTLSYRLVSVGQDGNGNTPLFGVDNWNELTSAQISAGTFTIPDPVVVGGTSVPVPTGRYRLDMRATANGASSTGKCERSTAANLHAACAVGREPVLCLHVAVRVACQVLGGNRCKQTCSANRPLCSHVFDCVRLQGRA